MNGITALLICLLAFGNIMNAVSNKRQNNEITALKEKVEILEMN